MASRNQRLDATISIGSVVQKSFSRNIGLIRSGLDSVGDEIKQITDRQRELSKQRRVLEREGRAVDELDREYEDLGRTLEDLRRKHERLERAQRAANRVGREFGRMTSEIGRLGRNAAIGIGAVGTAVFGVASTTAAAGDEVRRFADLSNASTTEFQRMAIGAQTVGIEQEKLADILKDVNDRVGDFLQTGGGPMADFFENVAPKVGVTAENFRNLSGPDALQLYVDTLQRANLSQQDMTFYMEAMASDATALIPLLRDNGEEMNNLADAGQRAGRVISDETIAASREFNKVLADSQGTVRGLRNIIGAELMPVVTEAMGDFNHFVRENRDEVEAFSEAFATGLRDALPAIGDVAQGVGRIATTLGNATAELADFVGGWENFGMVVGGLFAGRLIARVFRFGGAVFRLGRAMTALAAPTVLPVVAKGIRAVGVALAANPIGATITTIALAVGLMIENWEKIEPVLRPVLDWLGEKLTWLWENAGRPVIDGLTEGVDGIIAAWRGVSDAIGPILDRIGGAFDRAWQLIEPVIDGLRWVREKGAGAVDAIGGAFSGPDEDSPARFNPMTGEGAPQERAVGGSFAADRPLIVGERGPELIYPNRGGFVAHHRALERMAEASRAGMSAGAAAAQRIANVTQNITINAPQGMSVDQLVAELERRRRDAENDALFDGAAGWGQYGGAYG